MLGVDVGRPIKSVLGPALEQIELGLDDAICERIGVDIDLMHSPAVKTIDNQLCATEAVILGMAGDSAASRLRAAGGRRVRDPQADPARRAGLLGRGAAHGGGAGLWRAAVGENPKALVGRQKAPRISPVPATSLAWLAEAHLDGAEKYGALNWREKPIKLSDYIDAGDQAPAGAERGRGRRRTTAAFRMRPM